MARAARNRDLARKNIACARVFWPAECSKAALKALRELTTRLSLSVLLGELRLIDGSWYVTHSGLLRLAQRRHCGGIRVQAVEPFSDAATSRWVFKATVYKSPGSKGFVSYGDADPSNVAALVRGAELRVAETRAVNRALRKAYGIGLCSVEELGSFSAPIEPARTTNRAAGSHSGNGQPRLRDRLCLLIRQHRLDPTLIKRYAADFCGTENLREARRDLVESFINHLAEWVLRDRNELLCKLNSYARPQEAKS